MDNYINAAGTLSALEYAVNDMATTDLEDVADALSNLSSNFNDHEREFGYLSDDFDELEGWRECGFDVEDIEIMKQDIVDLKEEVTQYEKDKQFIEADKRNIDIAKNLLIEHNNLKEMHEQQRRVIHKLFDKLAGLHDQTSLESVLETISDLPVAPNKQLVKLPPNCS